MPTLGSTHVASFVTLAGLFQVNALPAAPATRGLMPVIAPVPAYLICVVIAGHHGSKMRDIFVTGGAM
ncbi:MAG: hypothetical protein ACTSUE_18380 [Promethearchaeota archaeon]